MNKRFSIPGMLSLILIFCIFGFQGCFDVEDGTKPLTELTAQQKSIMMFDMYNTEYTSYMIKTGYAKDQLGTWEKTSQPELTDDERSILQKKRMILVEVYPLIKMYDNYSKNGAQVNPELEAQIFSLLDRVVQLIPD